MSLVFLLSSTTLNAAALDGTYDQQFYANNDILFYNPDVCSTNNASSISSGGGSVPAYANPVRKVNGGDPSVIMDNDGTYYVYTSAGGRASSKDLVHWKSVHGGWNIKGAPNYDHNWAPDVAKVGSQYIITWAGFNGSESASNVSATAMINYAVGTSAGGPFKYGGKLTSGGYAIDPHIFVDDDGTPWLNWGGGVIHVAKLQINGNSVKITGPTKDIYKKTDNAATIENGWIEKKDGWYYLFFSQGHYQKSNGDPQYSVKIARSKTITGPYKPSQYKTILAGNSSFWGPGGQSITKDSSGAYWLIYAAIPPGVGDDRYLMIDPITWGSDGWPVINSGNGPSSKQQAGAGSSSGTSTVADTSSGGNGTFRIGSYNAAGVTMQKGGIGGLKQAQSNLNAGMAVEAQNNATVVALQEVAKGKVKMPAGWSAYYSTDKGNRIPAVAWKTDTWTAVEKDNFTVPNPGMGSGIYTYPYVTLKDKSGNAVTVMSIHLASGLHKDKQPNVDTLRREQAKGVRDQAQKLQAAGKIVVIGGDFNYKMPATSQDMQPFVSANPNYKKSVDNIFGGTGVSFSNWKTVSDTGSFTDHPLIFSDVSLTGSSTIATSAPTGDSCTCPNSGSTTSASLTGSTNLEKIYNYFLGKGLSPVQAAGIVGNIAIESGGYPQRKQSTPSSETYPDPSGISSGWGLIQWTPGSKIIDLLKAANIQGSPGDLGTQLDLIWAHMHNKPPITKGSFSIPEYKNITDVTKAVDYFEDKIEGAGVPNLPDRHTAAKLALDQFSGGASTSSVASTLTSAEGCGSTSTSAVTGNIVQTAINYAWSNRNVDPKKAKPAYASAIAKAKTNGKYTGGCDGMDCGAFITRVMQDSGVDPNYGGGGNTEIQLKYLQSHPDLYQEIRPTNTADLKPGDIAIQNSGNIHHTYMYVGKQSGFNSTIASASQCQHFPWAGSEAPADRAYHWFRYIGSGGGDSTDV